MEGASGKPEAGSSYSFLLDCLEYLRVQEVLVIGVDKTGES